MRQSKYQVPREKGVALPSSRFFKPPASPAGSNWDATARDNLGHMDWCGLLNEGIPIGVSGLTAQRDKQHLFEGYPGVLYAAAGAPTYKPVHLPLLGVG